MLIVFFKQPKIFNLKINIIFPAQPPFPYFPVGCFLLWKRNLARTPESTRRELRRKVTLKRLKSQKVRNITNTNPFLTVPRAHRNTKNYESDLRKKTSHKMKNPATTKIYKQNPFTLAAAKPKLQIVTHKTNVQGRNEKNGDQFGAPPIRHRRLDTQPFYFYNQSPKCYRETNPFSLPFISFCLIFFLSFIFLHS